MNDRLSQIEARAKTFHATVWLGNGGESAEILYEVADEMADDVVALVEIAKAARDIESKVVDGPEWNVGEIFNSAGRLRRALSVLDDREET